MTALTGGDLDLEFDLRAGVTPENNRITVLLDLPHLPAYGRESTVELVYGCRFAVAEGDLVWCPPTPRYNRWTTGVVVALHGRHYRGPVKYVQRYERNHHETETHVD